MKLSEVFTASYRENPLCYWLRNILGIAACFFALFAVINLANGAMPARDELTEISGHYLRLERDEEAESLYLYVETDSGLTERYLLESILHLDTAALSQTLTPGTAVTLRYQNDERRSVYELTAGDVPLLTYAQAEAADRENRYWGYGLVAVATVTALGLLVGWALWDRRKRVRAQAARDAEKARRDEEAVRLAAQEPAVYAPEEREAVEAYIREAFGPVAQVFHEPPMHDLQLDIAVVTPTPGENFYRLITVGMGAHRMDVPPSLAEKNQAYAELCIFLPPEWNLLGDDEDDTWPFTWLKKLARMPFTQREWVGAGHIFPADGALCSGSSLRGILLGWAQVRGEARNRVLLGSGKLINFYQLYPVTAAEMAYQEERSSQMLWDRMMRAGVSPVVDVYRESCCDPDTWFEEDIAPFVWTEGEDEFYLGLDAAEAARHAYSAEGYPTDGYGWEKLARKYVDQFGLPWASTLEYRCDERTFFVAGSDADFLRSFALNFHDFCDVPERVRALAEGKCEDPE